MYCTNNFDYENYYNPSIDFKANMGPKLGIRDEMPCINSTFF